jgi:nucleoside-diphosphate-sugar epimerase
MTGTTLITGADGYLGRMIAARLAAGSEDRLLLAVRASGPAELAAKQSALAGFLGSAAASGRVTVTGADLRDEDALGAVDPDRVTRIVHGAAVCRFNVDQDTAARVNVDGTARVCELARRCPKLERLLLLSTVYSAGRRTGDVDEIAYPDSAGFVNYYEWSKWTAEQLALGTYGDLPLTVLRLSTVVADSEAGTVTQFNAFHHTLKLLFYGLMSIVPGAETTPIHVTSGEYSAAVAERLLDPALPGGIYHACPGTPSTFRELIDTAFAAFEADDGFRRRSLVRPPFCSMDSYLDLVRLARITRSGPVLAALETFTPFAEQLYLHKSVSSDRLRAAWPGHREPDQRQLVESACAYLVATRWGRKTGEDRSA